MAAGPGFYERKAEGWFWYAEPEPVPEEELTEEQPLPPVETEEPEQTEKSEKGPAPLSVAWFQQNLTQTLHKAIDNPTEENIKAYYVLHKIMTEKSHYFADQSRLVAIKNPQISNFGGRTGTNAQVSRVKQFQREVLKKIGERLRAAGGGLVFFHDDTIYSQQLALTMEKIDRFDGIDVRGVRTAPQSLSGPASHLFQDALIAPTLHTASGLKQTPSVALAIPPAKPIALIDGMSSRTEIQKRLVILAKEYRIITEEEYEQYIGRNPGFAPRQITAEDLDQVDIDDPDSIIALEKFLENG